MKVLLLFSFILSVQLSAQTADEYFLSAQKKAAAGDFKRALEEYSKAIGIDLRRPELYYNRGLARIQLHDRADAILDWDKTIALDPRFEQAYFNRGLANFESGDVKAAIRDYDAAIRLDSSDGDAFLNRGLAKFNTSDKKGAIADFSSAIARNLNDAGAYNYRGIAKRFLGDEAGARADRAKAAKIDPKYGKVTASKVQSEKARGEREDGESKTLIGRDKKDGKGKSTTQTVTAKPDRSAAFYFDRGKKRGIAGDADGALADLSKTIEIDPQHSWAFHNRGYLHLAKGDKAGSCADFKRAVALGVVAAEKALRKNCR
jgi:tetratricopeptide (TPR) repeat protein